MSSLAVYVFFNHLYVDQQKNYPKVIILAKLFHCQWNESMADQGPPPVAWTQTSLFAKICKLGLIISL